ncbi:FecR domain-containing protein [Bremerella sp. T1]|uniref:FecR domain-containing protein n=1 Tax=Bremerella sp. TYQ1 TaxID=3119568 RepID=UPI001CD0302F|nr:FecR domain-containing protein [Bremerella volcania]UBM35351.1 FecR domain-containing protein [Bremerella volcania]
MNDQPTSHSPELITLAAAYCEGTLDDSDKLRLEELLRGNTDNQRVFLGYLDLHARLCWEARSSDVAPDSQPDVSTRKQLGSLRSAPWMSVAIALSLLAVVTWGVFQFTPNTTPITPSNDLVIATVVRAVGRWGDELKTVSPGYKLRSGVFELPQGIVELEWPSGVRMILESPARLDLVDREKVFLHTGRLVTKVPPSGVGFVIETERVRLVDLGTEFGVSVGLSGSTDVQVYEGAVDAQTHTFNGNRPRGSRLHAGDAFSFDGTPKKLAFAPDRFIRRFPSPRPKAKTELPYNQSTIETIHAVHLDQAPVIDGSLREWENASAFSAACIEPYSDTYHVHGTIGYDEEHLYIAMHVADPAPMVSMANPKTESEFFWTGGSVVLRLGANDDLGWPLNAAKKGSLPPGRQRDAAKDSSHQVVHLGMWYSKEQQASQLMLQYGIDCKVHKQTAEGWQGAFRRDPDGLGYTFEYAIDYELLNAKPPEPGDVWPSTLAIHWSDKLGRTCMGQLIENTNPDQVPFKTFDALTWGKLVFEP